MKLSIIIISYNEKQYLPQAIESCLRQKFEHSFEIIIGDDGSSDGSIPMIQEYAENYPDVIRYYVMDRGQEKDIIPSFRVSNVIKRGIELSRGEYIMILSGDDYFCDMEKFQKQVSFLDKHTRFQSCYTDYKKVWNNGQEEAMNSHKHISRAFFWSGDYVHVSCFAFRKGSVSKLLERFCDDTGLYFSSFRKGKTHFMPEKAFAYRQRDFSIMHEADILELAILELMLYQDVKNSGGYPLASMARFGKPLKYVWDHRDELGDDKYRKYLKHCSQYPKDDLNIMKNYRDLSSGAIAKMKLRVKMAYCLTMFFYGIRLLEGVCCKK